MLTPICGCGVQTNQSISTDSSSSSTVPPPPNIAPVNNPPARSGPSYTVGVDTPSLQACANNSVPESTCILPSGFIEPVVDPIEISTSHITIQCISRASIIAKSSSRLFILTGTDIAITGCDLDGGVQSGYTSYGLALRSASSVKIFNNTFHDFANAAIRVTGGSNIDIEGNRFSALHDNALYGEMTINNIIVANNPLIDVSQRTDWGAAIALHSTDPGETVTNTTISNNFIKNGSSFCVEIGAFGGNPPSNISLLNNYCQQGSDTGDHGGYSFANTTGLVAIGNLYDLHGTTKATLPGIELVLGNQATVTGNSLYGLDLSLDRQSESRVSNNAIHNPISGMGIYIGANVSPSTLSGNLVTENHIDYSVDNTSKLGIWFQCDADAANCSSNQITNNFLNNLYISGVGIKVQRNKGVMQNNSITGNTISQFQTCIEHSSDSNEYYDNSCN
jgi:Right handed beta helix region